MHLGSRRQSIVNSFLSSWLGREMGLAFHISEVSMLRMQGFEIREWAAVWANGCGPFLPLGCLAGALFHACCLPLSSAAAGTDRHICWAAGIGPDCVCTVWSYLGWEPCWPELHSSPSLRMLCASWPWQPWEEMGLCAETMRYQKGLETSCLFCLFIKHQL